MLKLPAANKPSPALMAALNCSKGCKRINAPPPVSLVANSEAATANKPSPALMAALIRHPAGAASAARKMCPRTLSFAGRQYGYRIKCGMRWRGGVRHNTRLPWCARCFRQSFPLALIPALSQDHFVA
ncbi:MAG: hypothetical protein MnENMB40S_21740 [Rhizobiaceae bacterium MnEN-MB40S]|nr:MAG: hypothetical protein MnENMB40S_21740 [Rhizobiaceae bacterium MnEN-MB40S]